MTDLIKRLREIRWRSDLMHEAADRIEELVKERGYTEGTNDTLIALNQSLEAKLTKAVEALRHTLDKPRSADQTYAALWSEVMWEIRFVLAELEGK